MSPDLVTIINPLSLGNGCCTFGFLIFIIVKRNFLYKGLYILTERSLKHPSSTRGLGPRVFLSLSLSLSLPPADSLEDGNPLSSFSCPGFQDLLERVPCAFVSSASPVLGSLHKPGNISFFLSFTFLASTLDCQVPVR